MRSYLYSPYLEDRYRATINVAPGRYSYLWPRACWGAANGWLLLIGPSPGRADNDDDVWVGGPNRPIDSRAIIGPNAGDISFNTNKARNNRWDKLREAVFDKMSYANALTTLANLDWGHYPDSREIPDAYLKEGCEIVQNIMKKSKPRIIITLVKRTWEVLLPSLAKLQVFDPPYQSVSGLDCRILRLTGNKALTLLMRSPQHPSRHFFNKRHEDKIHYEVKHFLAYAAND